MKKIHKFRKGDDRALCGTFAPATGLIGSTAWEVVTCEWCWSLEYDRLIDRLNTVQKRFPGLGGEAKSRHV